MLSMTLSNRKDDQYSDEVEHTQGTHHVVPFFISASATWSTQAKKDTYF